MYDSALTSTRKFLLASAGAALLTLAAMPLCAQPDPPAEAGRLSYITGNVSFQPVGSDNWGEATPNLPLGPGDRIVTDDDGQAEIQVGQTFVRIGHGADVTLVDSTPEGITFGVAQGSIHLHVNGLWDGQAVYVSTPSGSSDLNRPGDLRVDVLPDQQAAIFTNFNGFEQITGANDLVEPLGTGQAIELIGSNPVEPQWLQPSGMDDLDFWSQHRDQAIANAASYQYVSREVPGAYELDAAGSWQAGTPYGAVWFPNSVQAGWAPYHYGHWVNHAPWGWVWVEDESWGYAPFHYGRWVSYNGRWGWIPGPPAAHPIWSPALVVFAGGIQVGGVGVSAWFPLGPGEAYKPWYPCSPRYVDQVNITNIVEAPRVHVQTTYVNINVVNVTYVNRTTVTAMRQEDFAAGRPAREANVVVDVHQMDHVQVLAAPAPRPTAQSFTGKPPARPVRVAATRPVLINHTGMAVAAAPGARPMAPPVKAAPVVQPLAGHKVVAPPPGAKPAPVQPAGARPAPPTKVEGKPEPVAKPEPMEKPAPAATKPAVEPEPKPAAEPAAKPAEPAAKPGTTPPAKNDKNRKNDKNKDKDKDKDQKPA